MDNSTTPAPVSPGTTENVPSETGVAPARENVVDISKAKKPSPIDVKRFKARMERRQRLINKGVPEDKVDLVMAQEDYQNLPSGQKIARLESMISQLVKKFTGDMMALRMNDGNIADAFDINYRAISKCFNKLGITPEQQNEFMQEAQREILAEQAAKAEAQKKAQEEAAAKVKADAAAAEQAKVEAEAKAPPAEAPPPEEQHPEASVFTG